MRSKALIILAAICATVGAVAAVASAQSTPTPVRVAPMVRQCQIPSSEMPSPGAHLSDAQISALCKLPGATKG